MKMHYLCSFVFCLISMGMAQTGLADVFKAAAGRVDITPPAGVPMWGYSNRSGPSGGTLDPLFASVLVLESGEDRIGLVTLDLGRTFGPDSMNSVRERVARSAGVDQVFFVASHTHSGPVIDDSYPESGTPEWELQALEKIGETIEETVSRLVPAKIGTGYGDVWIGHNRRRILPDGSVEMMWGNPSRVPTYPVDPRVGIIRIDGTEGRPLALLVNFACHPVILGPDNLSYSSDYVGAMRRTVQEAVGGGVIPLFLQGACGDINPYYDKMPLKSGAVGLVSEEGTKLGNEVARLALAVQTEAPEEPSVKYRLAPLAFEQRWDLKKIGPRLEQMVGKQRAEMYRRYFEGQVICPVMTLVLNDKIAMMGMPGEPFVEFGLEFRTRAPLRDAFFVGYANGYYGYFPTVRASVEGGYGAGGVVVRTEVGAGERMLDEGVIGVYRLLGLVPDLPQ